MQRLAKPKGVKRGRLNWASVTAIVSLHILCLPLLSPWLFDWRSVTLMFVTLPIFGVGINLCYHRQLTHRSFRTPLWLEHVFVGIALCCLQDTPATWVANHRMHHAKADRNDDPHSTLVSLFWAHCGWLFQHNEDMDPMRSYQTYARDILNDRWYMRLEKGYQREWIYFGHAFLFFALGCAIGAVSQHSAREALRLGLSFLCWAVILRTVAIWHITWSVNSICHRFGYRSYDTNDQSTNNFLIGILAAGEGWHNNHHANPDCVSTQRRWWEIDLVYYCIKILEAIGLAEDLVEPSRKEKASVAA